jgi:hypothetical protein
MAELSRITANRSEFVYRAGRWIWLILVVLILTLTVIGVSSRYNQLVDLGQPSENALENLGLSVPFYAFFGTTLDLTIVLAHLAIAAFIFWKCTNMRVAVIVPIALIAGGAIIPFTNMYGSRTAAPLVQESVNLILFLGLLGSIALLYLFPDGRFVPRWTKFLAALWAALAFIAVFAPDWPISISALPAGIRMIVLLAWSGSGRGLCAAEPERGGAFLAGCVGRSGCHCAAALAVWGWCVGALRLGRASRSSRAAQAGVSPLRRRPGRRRLGLSGDEPFPDPRPRPAGQRAGRGRGERGGPATRPVSASRPDSRGALRRAQALAS